MFNVTYVRQLSCEGWRVCGPRPGFFILDNVFLDEGKSIISKNLTHKRRSQLLSVYFLNTILIVVKCSVSILSTRPTPDDLFVCPRAAKKVSSFHEGVLCMLCMRSPNLPLYAMPYVCYLCDKPCETGAEHHECAAALSAYCKRPSPGMLAWLSESAQPSYRLDGAEEARLVATALATCLQVTFTGIELPTLPPELWTLIASRCGYKSWIRLYVATMNADPMIFQRFPQRDVWLDFHGVVALQICSFPICGGRYIADVREASALPRPSSLEKSKEKNSVMTL